MDCSLGRHRNPFCYIFSLACLLLPVCMWWRDVISAQSAETSDNSHQTALVCSAFTARTGTPWAWRRSTWGVAQKNISPGAAGVEKHRAWLREGAGSGCQLMLSMKPQWCHKARRYWGVPSRKVVWKIQRGLSEVPRRAGIVRRGKWGSSYLADHESRLPLYSLSCAHTTW